MSAPDTYIKRVSLADLEGYGSTTQPADTRIVTVAQLDRWLGCLVSLEIKDEIRAIIGSTEK